jgi:hypothetical protein
MRELNSKMFWQARRDSNPQHPDLESDALPLELLACIIEHTGIPTRFSIINDDDSPE